MPIRGPDVRLGVRVELEQARKGLKQLTLYVDDVGKNLATMSREQRQQAMVGVKGAKLQMQAHEKMIKILKEEAREQAKATTATKQHTTAIKSQDQAIQKSAHSFSSFSKAIGTSITLWYTARTAVYAVRNAIEQTIEVYRRGASAIDEFRMSVIGASAIIGPRMEEGSTAAEKMGLALQFATDMMLKLELVAAKHIATGRSLQMVWEALAISGTIATEEDVENVAKLADLITLYTKGQRLEVQLMQEVRGLMDGQVRAQNKLAYTLDRILNGQLKEHLKMWRAMGRDQEGQLVILREIANLLGDIGSLEGEILATAQTWRNTLETVINRILRSGTAEYYEDLGTALKEAATFLLDFNTGLTYQGQLVVDILTVGWERLKDILEGILRMDFGDLGSEATEILENMRRFLTEVDAKAFGEEIRGAFNVAVEAADKFLDILKIIFVIRAPVWIANFARLMGLSVAGPILAATGKLEAFKEAWAGFAVEIGLIGTGILAALGLNELSKLMDKTFTPEQRKGLEEYKAALDELGLAVIFSSTAMEGLTEETEEFTGMHSWIKGSLEDLKIIVEDLFDTFSQSTREVEETEERWKRWLLDGIVPVKEELELLPPVMDDFADSVEGVAEPIEDLAEAIENYGDEMKRLLDLSPDMSIVHKRLEQDVDSLNKSFQELTLSEFKQSLLDLVEFGPDALLDFQKSVEFTLKAVGETWETMSERTKELIEERLKILLKILAEEKKAEEKAARESVRATEKAMKEKEQAFDRGLAAVIKYYANLEKEAEKVYSVIDKVIEDITKVMEEQREIELEIMVDWGGEEALESWKKYLAERAEAYGVALQALTKKDLEYIKKFFAEWKKGQRDVAREWEKIWDRVWENFQKRTGDIIYDFVTDFEGAWEDLADTMYDIFARLFADNLSSLITTLFKDLAKGVGDWLGDIFKKAATDAAATGAEGILGTLGKLAGPIAGVAIGGIGMAVTSLFGGRDEEAERQRQREIQLLGQLADTLKTVNAEWEDLIYGITEVEETIRSFNRETARMISEFAEIAHIPGVVRQIEEIEEKRRQALAKLIENMAEDLRRNLEETLGRLTLRELTSQLIELHYWFQEIYKEAKILTEQTGDDLVALLKEVQAAKVEDFFEAFTTGIRSVLEQAGEIVETTGLTALQRELYDLSKWAEAAEDELKNLDTAIGEMTTQLGTWTEEQEAAIAALAEAEERVRETREAETAAMGDAKEALKGVEGRAKMMVEQFITLTGSFEDAVKILDDYSRAQLEAYGFTEEMITALKAFAAAEEEYNRAMAAARPLLETLPDEIAELGLSIGTIEDVIKELQKEFDAAQDPIRAAQQVMFDEIVEGWKQGMRDIIDEATLTPYQKAMKEINQWYEDQTANLKSMKDSAEDLELSTTELENAERLLDLAYKARIESAESLKDSMIDASSLVEELQAVIDEANVDSYTLAMKELRETADRQAALLREAGEDWTLAYRAMTVKLVELAAEARAEIDDFLDPILDILARDTMSDFAYQMYRVDQWLIDTLKDAEGLADAADYLGITLDEVIKKVKEAAEAQKESVREAAEERFFKEIYGVLDRFELTPFEREMNRIAEWEKSMIELAGDLGLSTELVAKAVGYLKEEAKDLLDIVDEDIFEQLTAPWQDIIDRNTLGEVAYQVKQINDWYTEQAQLLEDSSLQGEQLAAAELLLKQARDLQLEAIEAERQARLGTLFEGWQDIINKETMDEWEYQLAKLDIWTQRQLDALEALEPKADEYTEGLELINDAVEKQTEAIMAAKNKAIADLQAGWEDIIKEQTLDEVGYEIYKLNIWYEEQKQQAIKLGVAFEALDEAFDLLLADIIAGTGELEEALKGLHAELDDIIAKNTLNDVDYQLFRLGLWAAETEARILALNLEGDELNELWTKYLKAFQLQQDAITSIDPEDLTDQIKSFNDNLDDIIAKHTLTDYQYELFRINRYYEEQTALAIKLGQSLDKVNEARRLEIEYLQKEPLRNLLENIEDYVLRLQRAGWGVAEYEGLFSALISTFQSLDKNSEDYYFLSLELLTDAFGALKSIESLQTRQLQRMDTYRDDMRKYYDSIRQIQDTITEAIVEFGIGTIAPVQSLEAVQAEYERLWTAAHRIGPASEVEQAVNDFIAYAQGPYADFMAAYSDNYATIAAEIVRDLQALRNWVEVAVDRPIPEVPQVVTGEVSIMSGQWQLLLDLLTELLQETITQGEDLQTALTTITVPGGENINLEEPITFLPGGQAGGLFAEPTIGGERGPEWFVPTYEPERSRFLQDVGADPDAIADAITEKLGPLLTKGRQLVIQMDNREVASMVIDEVSRNSDLIQRVRKFVK